MVTVYELFAGLPKRKTLRRSGQKSSASSPPSSNSRWTVPERKLAANIRAELERQEPHRAL